MPEKILLIRLSALGDVLFTLPAVNAVREHYPHAHLTYLVAAECSALLAGFAAVDEVVVLERQALQRFTPRRWWQNTVALAWRLRHARYDLVIDFHGFGETALLARLTGAPHRWGRLDPRQQLWSYTRCLLCDDKIHPVVWNLALLAEGGLRINEVNNEFIVPDVEIESAHRLLASFGCDPRKPILYLQPYTSTPDKNWPFEKYLALAQFWREHDVQVVFGGGSTDRVPLEGAERAGFPVLAGFPLLTVAGVVKLSTLLVGGDTGVSHLAVALGKPVVMIMHSAATSATTPFGHPDWVLAPPPSDLVSEIDLQDVIAASARTLSHARK